MSVIKHIKVPNKLPEWVDNFPRQYQDVLATLDHVKPEPANEDILEPSRRYAELGKRLRASRDRAEQSYQDAIRCHKIEFKKQPLQIYGMPYHIFIGDDFMWIGCLRHTLKEWETISDKDILKLDGKKGLEFWRKHKSALLQMAKTHQADN